MSVEKIYKCDNNCGKKAVGIIPAGWFLLGGAVIRKQHYPKGIELDKTELKLTVTHHFCSEKCMNEAVKIQSKKKRP